MELQGVREHDEDHDGCAADGRGQRAGILRDDVAANVVSEREIARDGDEDVDACCGTDGAHDDAERRLVAVVFNLVHNRKHLVTINE